MSLMPTDKALMKGVQLGQRRALAKAITLLESTRADHRIRAEALLNALAPNSENSLRLGISGVPGVGKSTFIEGLGLALIEQGHKVAVLAVDPSSSLSGGSILGDKTRMERLSVHESAFIRPSPARGTLGGVTESTRESIWLCEAAGYDVVLVETVGVGQSEAAVAGMTDLFVLLQLPNAGDDLQALKKGVMELADLIVINKADIDPAAAARAQSYIESSLHLSVPRAGSPGRAQKVMQVSALKNHGLDSFWSTTLEIFQQRRSGGELAVRRKQQCLTWMWDLIHARLLALFREHPMIRAALPKIVKEVESGNMRPTAAARALLDQFEDRSK